MTQVLCVGLGGVAGEGSCTNFYFRLFFKNPDEIFPWIDSTAAAALDERIPDGVGLSGGFTAHEEPFLSSEFGRADAVLDESGSPAAQPHTPIRVRVNASN